MKTIHTAKFRTSTIRLAKLVEREANFTCPIHRKNARMKYLRTSILAAASTKDLLAYTAHIYGKYGG